MKIYLVGGAVRDQLLSLPVKDRDWVVTGATPEEMIRNGFKPVGKSFPVFLHPQTGEEYALARKERKYGHGYQGFICDFDPSITLSQDLMRRDLTINAMAIDEEGQLIDPYGGKADLENRVLRHVSDAFSEDPLRVLRVARFMCRFASMGFKVEAHTNTLITQIAASGELSHLTQERIWQELERSLREQSPLQFFQLLYSTGSLNPILPEFSFLFKPCNKSMAIKPCEAFTSVKQTVISQLEKIIPALGSPQERWGSLFYFLQPLLPSEDSTNDYIDRLCDRTKAPHIYRHIAKCIANCAAILRNRTGLTSHEILSLFNETNGFRQPKQFLQTINLCHLFQPLPYSFSFFEEVLNECRHLSAQPFIEQGLKGPQIGQALLEARCQIIASALNCAKS